MWKKISSKIVLKHPRITVVEDQVELPDGYKTEYIRFESNGNAPTIIVIDKNNKILVLKEYSYPTNEWIYQFPGGFVPNSEDLKIGINRELMEEVGLKANNIKLLGEFYSNHRRTNSKVFVFLGTDLTKEEKGGDKEEDIKQYWFSEKEIDEMIKDGKFLNGSSLGAWAIYKTKD